MQTYQQLLVLQVHLVYVQPNIKNHALFRVFIVKELPTVGLDLAEGAHPVVDLNFVLLVGKLESHEDLLPILLVY